jgi:hypothetical protein
MRRHLWFLMLGLVVAASVCTTMGSSERAGLGTSWGETRESRVYRVDFERDDGDRPFVVSRLYYDDPDGVRALARELSPVRRVPAAQGPLRVRLVDDRGLPLPTFWRGGMVLVEGRRGQRYAIEIGNGSLGRIEAVATVDGLDVMDGERGSFAKRGYVLGPGETYRVDGFRRSQAAVAAFRFGTVDESYAARTGDDTNVGVVGVAFFAERGAVPPGLDDEAARRAAADPFPDRFAQPPPSGGWWETSTRPSVEPGPNSPPSEGVEGRSSARAQAPMCAGAGT